MLEASNSLSEEEQTSLLTGENYILYHNLKGCINIWINSDPEMQVSIDSYEFTKIAQDLFPGLQISKLLKLLNQGSYVFTDKMTLKPLRPSSDMGDQSVIPSLQDALQFKKASQARKVTPYGFSF